VPRKAEEHGDEDDDDPFYSDSGLGDKEKLDDSVQARQLQAAKFARDIVELHALGRRRAFQAIVCTRTPFPSHGMADKRVSVRLGGAGGGYKLGLDVTISKFWALA